MHYISVNRETYYILGLNKQNTQHPATRFIKKKNIFIYQLFFCLFQRAMTLKEPSPAQLVPRAYPTPVHRDSVMRGTISSTPSFRDKVPGKSGYPLLRFPRK